jgi:putative inorganic carbon (HCO3(-)) transporter
MAFAFLVLYILLILIRPQDWYAPLRGFHLVEPVAILTIFVTFISQKPGKPLTQILAHNKYVRFMWGFLGAIVLSEVTKFHLSGTKDAVEDFGKVAILFFLVLLTLDEPRRLRQMMWIMLFCTAFMCINAWMQIKTGTGIGGMVPVKWTGEAPRVKGPGIFDDPNDLASLFTMTLPFALCLWKFSRSPFSKIFVLAMIPAILYGLYHTHSRGGLVGFCAMVVAYIWLVGRSSLPRLVMATAVLALVVAFAPGRAGGSFTEGSASGRVLEWGTGNQMLKDFPLFGAGYQKFPYYSNWRAAHSSIVTCYAELGIVGYVFWFGLSWVVMKSLFRLARLKDQIAPAIPAFSVALFSALVGFHATGFFLTRTYNHLLFILLGMGVALIRYASRQPEIPAGTLKITGPEIRQTVILALCSAPAIWILARLYWQVTGGGD